MSNEKNFVGMVNMINNISSGDYDSQENLHEYVRMVESISKLESTPTLEEDEMSKELEDKREEYVKELKGKEDYFKEKYGDQWENVMYGTATNLAKQDLGIE